MAKWWHYLINPIGAIGVDAVNFARDFIERNLPHTEYGEPVESTQPKVPGGVDNKGTGQDFVDVVTNIYDDLTGKSQIELQNKLNREMAEEEYQRNLQAISDTASAYEAAGFNRNLMYSSGSQSYTAPQLQAYSGSAKIDNILSRAGKVLNFIPAMYQATAALEGIDQARERTKQSEIKTMSMGMSLIDQGYKLGNAYLSNPFTFNLDYNKDRRHFRGITPSLYGLPAIPVNNKVNKFEEYADAALKNKFDLLHSIGIKNDLNSVLKDWRGYQYDLDRRFGAAGRIVGMAAQGAGAVNKLFMSPKDLLFRRY